MARTSRKLSELIANLRYKAFNNYFENLTSTDDTDYSLW